MSGKDTLKGTGRAFYPLKTEQTVYTPAFWLWPITWGRVEFSTCGVSSALKRYQIWEHFRYWVFGIGLLNLYLHVRNVRFEQVGWLAQAHEVDQCQSDDKTDTPHLVTFYKWPGFLGCSPSSAYITCCSFKCTVRLQFISPCLLCQYEFL